MKRPCPQPSSRMVWPGSRCDDVAEGLRTPEQPIVGRSGRACASSRRGSSHAERASPAGVAHHGRRGCHAGLCSALPRRFCQASTISPKMSSSDRVIVPLRVVAPEPREVADVADVVALARLVHVLVAHLLAGQLPRRARRLRGSSSCSRGRRPGCRPRRGAGCGRSPRRRGRRRGCGCCRGPACPCSRRSCTCSPVSCDLDQVVEEAVQLDAASGSGRSGSRRGGTPVFMPK